MKIAHIADIQINADDRHSDRMLEYRSVLHDCAKQIIACKCDIAVIAGDIFERYNTTDNERELYVQFVHKLLEKNIDVVVIDGNHDLRKRNLTYYDGAESTLRTNVLSEINAAINSDRYHYCRDAKLFNVAGVMFACWSESARYEPTQFKWCPYEGVDVAKLKDRYVLIDVFHGTLPGAKDLGSNFEFTPDAVKLQGHTAMLGHIHKFQQLGNAVYSSSPVQRSFNEGIRFEGEDYIYDYSNAHGWVLWDIDDLTEQPGIKFEFKPLFQPVLMTTFVMDQRMTKDIIIKHLQGLAGRNLSIKLIIDEPIPEALAFMYNYVAKLPNCNIKKAETVQHSIDSIEFDGQAAQKVELSIDSIANIATELVKPVIDEANSDEQYAHDVLERTLTLLRQELGYHLHTDARSKVRIVSADITNFKTIGHAHIDFAEHGLTALRGQNGQGKTTCFEAIAFALTGKHNRTFKNNANTKQLVRLFNDKDPGNNVCRIEVNVSIDGKAYSVIVTLEKFSSQTVPDKYWKNFVTKVTKHVQIYCGDNLLHDDNGKEDGSVQWLLQYFGTYEEFAILHLLDQVTLESIKYMSADELSNFILQRLGYSFIGKLQYFYNGCKATEQQRQPKPTEKTYVELCQEEEQHSIDLHEVEQQLDEQRDALADANSNITVWTESINAEQRKRKSLPADLIKVWQNAAEGYDLQTIDKLIEEQAVTVKNAEQAKQAYDAVAREFTDIQSRVQAKLAELVEQSKQYITAQITLLTNEQTRLRQDIERIKDANVAIDMQASQYRADIANIKSEIAGIDSECTSTLASIDSKIKFAEQVKQGEEQKVAELTEQIESLHPGICPLCGNNIELDKFEEHKQELQRQLRTHISNVNTCKADIANLQNERSIESIFAERKEAKQRMIDTVNRKLAAMTAKQSYAELETKLNDAGTKLQDFNAKLAKLSTDDYRLLLLRANDAKLADDYASVQAKLSTVDSNAAEKYDFAVQYANRLDNAKFALNSLQSYEAMLQANAQIDDYVRKFTDKIEQERSKVANIQSVINNQVATKTRHEEAIKSVQALKLQVVAYNISQEALKRYKWLVFDALPKYLYSSVTHIVNEYIARQNLPSSICPRLDEQAFGQLMLIDRMHDGNALTRPIIEASGMEITIAGLVICLALHDAKLNIDFPMVLLDELSGKLNTGTTDDTTNYLEVLSDVLSKASATCQIMMIDHRLPDTIFDNVITIVKDPVTNISHT